MDVVPYPPASMHSAGPVEEEEEEDEGEEKVEVVEDEEVKDEEALACLDGVSAQRRLAPADSPENQHGIFHPGVYVKGGRSFTYR